MAYSEQDKHDMYEAMVKAIEKHKIKFYYQLFAYVPQHEDTGTKFLKEIGKFATIKDLINRQKTEGKVKAINKWEKSDNAALQLAYFKLLANESELDRLTLNKNQNENKEVDKFKIIESDEDSGKHD